MVLRSHANTSKYGRGKTIFLFPKTAKTPAARYDYARSSIAVTKPMPGMRTTNHGWVRK
jgi:hypothetical protein